MMTEVIAKELPLQYTAVSEVMMPDPEPVMADVTVLEALQVMHDDKVLTLPVCEEDGTVVGVVDVMALIYGCGGAEGWRSIFDSALDVDDDASDYQSTAKSDHQSVAKSKTSVPVVKKNPVITVAPNAPFVSPIAPFPGNIPKTLEFTDDMDESTIGNISEARTMTIKVVDPSGSTHRLRSEMRVDKLKEALSEKIKINTNNLQFKFVDDEGDVVVITSDEDLAEAVNLSQDSAGKQVIKLIAEEVSSGLDSMALAAIGAAVAFIGVAAMIAFRPKR
jgi:CBS domain-containing protein